MSFGDGQVHRKRKVPENRTINLSDSESDDPDSVNSTEVRKVARLTSARCPRVESTDGHFDIHQASSSLTDDSSDSDATESEKCPICLKVFRSQTLGITDSCIHHTFCLTCLEEWSKTKRTCPVDRKEYNSILVLNSHGGVSKQIPIKTVCPSVDPWAHTNQPTSCEICGLHTNEELMLLCDGCDMGFHMYCLNPQMDRIPTSMWLCNECFYYYNY